MHGPKVSPDFLADAGENIDWSQFQQSTPRVGRVCDFFFFVRVHSTFSVVRAAINVQTSLR